MFTPDCLQPKDVISFESTMNYLNNQFHKMVDSGYGSIESNNIFICIEPNSQYYPAIITHEYMIIGHYRSVGWEVSLDMLNNTPIIIIALRKAIQ